MMAVMFPHPMANYPQKRRRTATTVLAGHHDFHGRDVLTSLLNGVGPNKDVEGDEELRKAKKKKDVRKDKRPGSSVNHDPPLDLPATAPDVQPVASSSTLLPPPPPPPPQQPPKKKKTFWSARPQRPNIQLMPVERSVSVTPPPGYSPIILLSGSPTPGPTLSTTSSRTSSKRPRTPDDGQDITEARLAPPKPRKKRKACRKGWKGWVEGSPTPSDKLINLDSAPILQERRTRSGKNFDAISVGKDSWV